MSEHPNNFAGTAWFYARYRPGYPSGVWDLLRAEERLDRDCRVLDLGCGTGEIALTVAPMVSEVVGVDLDEAMLAEAAAIADRDAVENVEWACEAAERFDAQPASFDLATIGSALHWMNAPAVLESCHRLLAPGGLLVVISGPNPLVQIAARDPIGVAIADTQARWFGTPAPAPASGRERPAELIAASAFGRPRVEYVQDQQRWNVERLVGFLCSTSSRPDQRLGPRFPDFVRDLTTAITNVEPSGEWTLSRHTEVVLADR